MAQRPDRVAGLRGRAQTSVVLGARDPRLRRNAAGGTRGEDYVPPLVVNGDRRLELDLGETLTVDADGRLVVPRFEGDVGDGASTSIAVLHKLGTRAVSVTLYENVAPYAEPTTLPTIEHTDPNTITLVFGVAPTAGQYHVVVR